MYHYQVSVVIPIFNARVKHLKEALNSIAAQTIDKEAVEIILVNDGSTSKKLLSFLARLSLRKHFKRTALRVLHHKENRWLAASRVTGAKAATADYLLFLDSDDFISPDYLKKALILLKSCPKASWVYPQTQCFGDSHENRLPPAFNAFKFTIRNRVPYASLYHRATWLTVSQRQRFVTKNIRFFEDWDTTIRLLAKGKFGLPLADTKFYYRKRFDGLLERPTRLYILSIYTTWRANLLRLPFIAYAQIRYNQHYRRGYGRLSRLNPLRIIEKTQARLIQNALESSDINATISVGQLFRALFFPNRFITEFLNPHRSISLAELRCGFIRKPNITTLLNHPTPKTNKQTILFAHTWWAVGGSENVLLNWCECAERAGFKRILEVTQYESETEEVRKLFAKHTNEQYCLTRIGATPRDRLNFLWSLIQHEKPSIIFISGNPAAYALTPLIQRFLPATKIIDILHNEWRNRFDWFSVSFEYQTNIDQRIAISDHWRDVLVNKYQEDPKRIQIHPNFIDTDRYYPTSNKQKIRERYNINTQATVLTFIGRLHEQKNPRIFCELAKRFNKKTNYVFLIVGSGPLEVELQEDYKSVENLRFEGSSQNVFDYISVSDRLIFTSRYEGFPLTSLEAASMNVPIIAPDIIGFKEQIERGNIGVLYAPTGDAYHDCDQIEKIIREQSDELDSIRDSGSARDYVRFHHSRRILMESQVQSLKLANHNTIPRDEGHTKGNTHPDLFLHIGWPKTGSSTIQHFLYHNRRQLAAQGFVYPELLSFDYAHHELQYYFSRKQLPSWLKDQLPTFDHYDRWAETHFKRLSGNQNNKVILSSEAFRRIDPTHFSERLNQFSAKVIVYLRRQDLFIESSINQQEKLCITPFQKLSTNEKSIAKLRKSVCDYNQFLDKWSDAFDKKNIKVVPFESHNFPNGLEQGFVEMLGVKWNSSFSLSGAKNSRLSRDCTAFLNLYEETNRLGNHDFHKILHLLEDYSRERPDPDEWRHILSPALRLSIINEAEPFNSQVAREYLGQKDGILFHDQKPNLNDPWEEYPGISDNVKNKITEYLLDNGAELTGSFHSNSIAMNQFT